MECNLQHLDRATFDGLWQQLKAHEYRTPNIHYPDQRPNVQDKEQVMVQFFTVVASAKPGQQFHVTLNRGFEFLVVTKS